MELEVSPSSYPDEASCRYTLVSEGYNLGEDISEEISAYSSFVVEVTSLARSARTCSVAGFKCHMVIPLHLPRRPSLLRREAEGGRRKGG